MHAGEERKQCKVCNRFYFLGVFDACMHACMHVLYLIKTGLVVKKFIVIILNRTTGVQRTNRVAILLVATRHFVVVGVVRLLLKNDL